MVSMDGILVINMNRRAGNSTDPFFFSFLSGRGVSEVAVE